MLALAVLVAVGAATIRSLEAEHQDKVMLVDMAVIKV
jgi:hypothetical protein